MPGALQVADDCGNLNLESREVSCRRATPKFARVGLMLMNMGNMAECGQSFLAARSLSDEAPGVAADLKEDTDMARSCERVWRFWHQVCKTFELKVTVANGELLAGLTSFILVNQTSVEKLTPGIESWRGYGLIEEARERRRGFDIQQPIFEATDLCGRGQ